MKSAGDKAKDSDFSSGIAKACKDYIEGGSIVTVDEGTVTAGEFLGSGKGSISLTDSLMSTPIDTAMNTMKSMTKGGDSVLATAIFNGLDSMVSSGTVKTDVKGVTTSPAGSPVPPSSGSAKGTMECSYDTFVSDLEDIFASMKSRYAEEGFDGDAYLAKELATLVGKYTKTGKVKTAGQGELEGSSGKGGIS